jgi:MSHA biogenesis protein MshL
MDSIVKAQDGQMVALGGLIRQRASTTDSQVPWLGGIPLIGNLFKQKSQEMEKRELVILLKPTIVQTGNEWSEEVRDANQRMNRLLDTDNARLFGGESSQK